MQLQVDGIVIVRKVSPATARVLVIPRDGITQVITRNLSHFTLALDLQTDYLLSFECQGCVTKQLVFDTHVPEGAVHAAPFDFPFQVTLEPPPTDAPFEYAGPVGLIRFDAAITDFGYDTDYKIARSEALAQRLEHARAELDRPTPGASAPAAVANPAIAPVAKAEVVRPVMTSPPALPDDHGPVKNTFEEMAPTRSEEPPLVHVTQRSTFRPVDRSTPRRAPAPSVIDATVSGAADLPEGGRASEVRVERLRVTTITRIQHNDHVTEYRRVAQYYGGTLYFKDGQACSERTYDTGVGE